MSRKTKPASLTALGRRHLPDRIEVGGARYARTRIFKNDFFAVTAIYTCDGRKVLVKVGRQASFLLVPLGWVGRLLAAREAAALKHLDDVAGVPRLIGRWGKTGILREYIEGRPLAKGMRVPDDFHIQLRRLIDMIHARGMAYVDLEKCENVLVGDDGNPYLFDFQICWLWPRRWGGELRPMRRLRDWFQAGDRYHHLKLRRRTRPDQLSPDELAASYRKPRYVRYYGVVSRPWTRVRRAILNRIDPRTSHGERGRIEQDDTVGVT